MASSRERVALLVLAASATGKSTSSLSDEFGPLLLSSKHCPEQDAAQDNGPECRKDKPFHGCRDRRKPHRPTGVAKARRSKKRKK